ncbi:DUF4255 domain-containing protein [Flavilitoribacter nigricans]|uniref:Pvc16 N-terminal domain-containing protein n=1 Tax=Flavilitoribacter nigricans (strain ATCC 23147 / DSM 23189 / NBRC 102662 / NCIMB 1420 / SS-2) TaxID=1122177 RepID=A0A2D0N275_FLAN2|nr:DUF4255 domain-containing protein [Flavilitoribacter nigricans]PHN02229.1 hypothetical protein CRP01_33385 [Flavilitoribacter nigricans DSM 23189 = NBRC 102662]
MIGSALQFVTNKMDAVIRQRLKSPPGSNKVILSSIMEPEGTIAIKEENVLLFSLVNIQKDPIAGGEVRRFPLGDQVVVGKAPSVHLNLFIILAAHFKAEQTREGLDMLSMGIAFLQGMPLWNEQTSPGMPEGIAKLIFELESPDFHQQSHIWGAIGAKYMPSVLYKVRTIIVDDGTIDQVLPTVKTTVKDIS